MEHKYNINITVTDSFNNFTDIQIKLTAAMILRFLSAGGFAASLIIILVWFLSSFFITT